MARFRTLLCLFVGGMVSLNATQSHGGSGHPGHASPTAEPGRIATKTITDFHNALVFINVLRKNGTFATAEVRAIELSLVAQDIFPTNSIEVAEITNVLGHIQTARGRYAEAIATYRRLHRLLVSQVKEAVNKANTSPIIDKDLPPAQTASDAAPRGPRDQAVAIVSLLETIAEIYVQLGRPKLASDNLDLALRFSSDFENASRNDALRSVPDDAENVPTGQVMAATQSSNSKPVSLQHTNATSFSEQAKMRLPLPTRGTRSSTRLIKASRVPDKSVRSSTVRGKRKTRVRRLERRQRSQGTSTSERRQGYAPRDPYAYQFHEPRYFPYDSSRYWRAANEARPRSSVDIPLR